MRKKCLSVLLALAMLLSLVPVTALAADGEGTEAVPGTETGTGGSTLLAGNVKEITKDLTRQTSETIHDKDNASRVAQEVNVTVTPTAKIPFSQANAAGRTDGWWAGIKIIAPTSVTSENIGAVRFRNSTNDSDRGWKEFIDGSDPYWMGAWNGITEAHLKETHGENSYKVSWYFNWDGNEETGIIVGENIFTNPMKGVDQVINFTFNLTESVELLAENSSSDLMWLGKQAIKVRSNGDEDGAPAEYNTAYDIAGLKLDETASTLTIDERSLKAVAEATETDTDLFGIRKILENSSNPDNLWFGMEYIAPAFVNEQVNYASVSFNGKAYTKVELNTEDKLGFYNYIKVYDSKGIVGPVENETATIQWLNANDKLLAVTRADVKVVVKYTKYTVRFNVGEGATPIQQQEVAANGFAAEPETPAKTGYAFEGWYKDEKCTDVWDFETDTVTGDTTIYAKWIPTYTVAFNLNGATGTAPDTQTIKSDEKATKPADPDRDGYTFGGWYKESDCKTAWNFTDDTVTQNTVLYAQWTPVTTASNYTVTFDLNGAAGTAPDTKTIMHGEKVTKPADPDRDGYTFGGWYKESDCKTAWNFTDDTVTQNTVLYAQWTPVTTTTDYTVTFDLNGAAGTAPDTQTIKPGEKATKPADPDRDGYTFGGWFKEPDCKTVWNFTNDTVTQDTILYAQWTPVTTATNYTVTFDLNGATGTAPDTQTIKSGEKATKPADPDRDGYTFGGWYRESDCKTAWDFTDDTVTQNTILYAKWTANEPTEPDTKDIYSISLGSYWHGKVTLSDTSAKPGTRVTITADPDTDYTVDSVIVRRSSGGRVSVYQSGRRYSFTMPSSDVSVEVEFALQGVYAYTVYIPPEPVQTTVTPAVTARTWRPAVTMRDVPVYSWAYPFAQWAYQNGYLDLAADGTFRLNDPVTNMQMWRIMAQWLDGPVWDEGSILNWANQNGAARGKVASGSMTRQNVVEYVYQSYFLLGGDVSVTGNLAAYRDNQLITSVASRNAWTWAVNKGLISGTPDGYLNPGGVVTRGEFAAILMRLCQNIMQ